jgi:hypothetical protein
MDQWKLPADHIADKLVALLVNLAVFQGHKRVISSLQQQ